MLIDLILSAIAGQWQGLVLWHGRPARGFNGEYGRAAHATADGGGDQWGDRIWAISTSRDRQRTLARGGRTLPDGRGSSMRSSCRDQMVAAL